MRTSSDGGSNWSDWSVKNSGDTIIPSGTDLTDFWVQWKADLTTSDTSQSPSLDDVTVTVSSPYESSGTLTSEELNNSGRGGVTLSYNATVPVGTGLGLEWRESSDGANWSGWAPVTSGQTYGSEDRFQWRANLSTSDEAATPVLHDVTAAMVGGDYIDATPLPDGKITRVFIDSGYTSVSQSINTLPTSQMYLTEELPTKIAFSGDGNTLFYKNPDDSDKLYLMGLNTGEKTKLSDTVPTDLKSDYDGNRVAFRDASSSLYLSGVTGAISGNVLLYSINNDGSVAYYKSNSLNIYTTENQSVYSGSVTCLGITRTGEQVFFGNTTSLKKVVKTPAGWKDSSLITTSENITGLWVSSDGSLVFLKLADGNFYVYEAYSKALRKLGLTAATIVRVTDDNRLIAQDANYNYLCYDPETDQTADIRPAGAKNPPSASEVLFDVDQSGSRIAYVASSTANGDPTGVGISSLRPAAASVQQSIPTGAERPERYLFSFDSKNSWMSYKDGAWATVRAGSIPAKADFDQYGMTIDEVNGLTAKDFASLYEGGRQVFNFDVAIYFASVNPYITPSLKGILVTLSRSGNGFGNELTEQALYAAKEQAFDGTNWRKVRKIYPVEISPKEAEIYYLVNSGEYYYSYKDSEWQGVEGTLLDDVEANWIDITLQGMTAEELRAIPEASLSEFSGNSFSVVYCMKVYDESTKDYKVQINFDYVEDLFESATLTLNVIYNDGTVKEYSGLTDDAVEDFMQWLNERQYNRGPIFYRIKVAGNNDFINYYMVQSVNVVEQ